MGPLQYVNSQRPSQGAAGRQRRCLLKECERYFRPQRPQSRFCSAACRLKARWWWRWRASQQYRCSSGGKAKRRAQAQRYRQRLRQRQAVVATNPTAVHEVTVHATTTGAHEAGSQEQPTGSEKITAAAEGPGRLTRCEGQRPAFCGQKCDLHACARPGCYVLFVVSRRSPCQKFCSVLCRQALRRVLDREKKWRKRRHERLRRRWQSPRSPPDSSF